MADNKKNIPDTGKMYEPPKPGKVEPVKADSPVQDQPTPAKAEAPVVEDASKMVTPPTAEQPAPAGKEAPKDKDAPAPSKESTPPGKDEKQTTIPGMGDPAPAGKVVDFTAARDGAAKCKPPEKAAAPDISEWEKEHATLSGQRTAEYTKLKETRAEVAELHNIRKCVDIALKADQPEQTRAKRHDLER